MNFRPSLCLWDMASRDVDVFVATRLDPRQREIVEALRALVREAAPGSSELITYGTPGWTGSGNRLFAIVSVVVSPSARYVVCSFTRGAQIHDAHGLLEGTGKATRHVKLRTVADLRPDALRDYVRQAVELDRPCGRRSSTPAGSPRPTGRTPRAAAPVR